MVGIKRLIRSAIVFLLILISASFVSFAKEAEKTVDYIPNLPVWDGTVADSFAGGDGTKESPYLVSDGSHLALLSKNINDTVSETYQNTAGKYYRMTNDIVLNDITDFYEWETQPPENEWSPGGATVNYIIKGFAGYFDGGHYDIYGMYVDSDNNDTGLFGYLYNGQIKNLGIKYSYVNGGKNTGVFVGHSRASSSTVYISGCKAENCVVNGSINVGGIVGQLESYTKKAIVQYCSFDGAVSSTKSSVGGIAGLASAYGVVYKDDGNYAVKFLDCINTGNISGDKGTGGIVGSTEDFTSDLNGRKIALLLQNCINSGKITSTKESLGGITGIAGPDNHEDKNVIIDIINSVVSDNSAEDLCGVSNGTVNSGTSRLLTTDGMFDSDNFKNFDFSKVWSGATGVVAPFLNVFGDSDGTGRVTAQDLIDTLEIFINKKSVQNFKMSNIDFDGDDEYSISDLNAFMRYLRGKGASIGS
ncbi:MAG: hypothetical protein IKI97_13710 [Clostridia bacterium]|nr:hypothetical protein [Clostridia bacterium]